MSVLVLCVTPVLAANDHQPYSIPDKNPGDYDEIKKVIIEGESNDPDENIHSNLQEAFSGGWNWLLEVNGVFDQEEPVCPPTVDEPFGARCQDSGNAFWKKTNINEWTKEGSTDTQGDAAMEANAKKTDPQQGQIPKVEGVPGRDTERAYGNIRSGLGQRRETGGTAKDIEFNPGQGRRAYIQPEQRTGFDYPTNRATTCGLTTVCRPSGHPDIRQIPPSGYQNAPRRDTAQFFCEQPCQRPLDDPGKPDNWDEEDSTQVQCGRQEPYEPKEDLVKYSCGGKETKGPDDGFCQELDENGQLAGVCQDLNSWVYIRWNKLVHICIDFITVLDVSIPIPIPIYLYEKGVCGFPAEVDTSEHSEKKREDNWNEGNVYECCSDDPYSGGKTYDQDHKGESCKPCFGEDCRLFPDTNEVIVNDVWLEPFPADLPEKCLIGIPQDSTELVNQLITLGFDPSNLGVNIGAWTDPDENLRKIVQNREYISFFREYADASYERSQTLLQQVPQDDHKKENIPVACYGMYDLAPEDAKLEKIENKDKRCTIAAYYEADDGDGDQVNFWKMKETQRGKGAFKDFLNDNPFGNPTRPFAQDKDLWWPNLRGGNINLGAFSMINDEVFGNTFHGDFSFTLLTTDSAKQRASVQLDTKRLLSSGALIRTPDDTITIEKDFTKERRTMVEWWHMVETQMHKNFTLPTVRLMLPTTWTIDLNPLDPLYTPPEDPEPGELSPDIRSESIEVQVQAREDLLGDVVSFMERALLLRIEGEPVPIVVPIVNPTELRAIAQGWEIWARKQRNKGLPGEAPARAVSVQLQLYADQADKVRKLRAELPRYAGAMLKEQRVVSKKLADWLDENIQSYRTYLLVEAGIQYFQAVWQFIQSEYWDLHDEKAFPWPRNERFTSPVYSLLDPWLPGRENFGDTTGGMRQYTQCFQAIQNTDLVSLCTIADQTLQECVQGFIPSCGALDLSLFAEYFDCAEFVIRTRIENGPKVFPDPAVCDRFFPLPPLLPQLPNTIRDPDIVLDFTAFREPQRTIKLPILKPIQIRIAFDDIEPPPLEQDKEPDEYPVLAPLPAFPDTLSDEIIAGLPRVITPAGHPDLPSFKEAAVFSTTTQSRVGDPFPKIKMPTVDFLSLTVFLFQTYYLIDGMSREYELFWKSLTLEKCEAGETSGCVREGTEQDCIRPHNDPKEKCVHFEADLDERFQRIGARPAIFLKDDMRSVGKFRDPIVHGQTYCQREDWACQLYNFYERKPRDGWMLDVTSDYDPDALMLDVRERVRDESSNIITNPDDRFRYDMPQEEMFENFRVPEAERIERYIERFEPKPLLPGEVCTDNFCTPPTNP
jgi:hypothetical protein